VRDQVSYINERLEMADGDINTEGNLIIAVAHLNEVVEMLAEKMEKMDDSITGAYNLAYSITGG
jgi:hypothetical protein